MREQGKGARGNNLPWIGVGMGVEMGDVGREGGVGRGALGAKISSDTQCPRELTLG